MTVYVMNTPILTDWGEYSFREISLPEVKEMLANGGFVSAIGHEGTAAFMSKLTGMEIPVNRVAIKMLPGESAIVFRVLTRLPEGVILDENEIAKIPFSFGILRMVR